MILAAELAGIKCARVLWTCCKGFAGLGVILGLLCQRVVVRFRGARLREWRHRVFFPVTSRLRVVCEKDR